MNKFVLLLLLAVFAFSCNTVRYVPVETTRTEYIDRFQRDSIFIQEQVFTDRWRKNDTVFISRDVLRFEYRDRVLRDSIVRIDSIKIPFPVEFEKRVKYVSGFQHFQIWVGRVFGAVLILMLAACWIFGTRRTLRTLRILKR